MHSLIEEIITDLEKQDFEQAIVKLHLVSETYQRNYLVFEILGNCYFYTKHYTEAVRNYEKALGIIKFSSSPDPKEVGRLYNKRGLAFCTANFYDEAIKDFWTAVELNPESADAFKNLAFCFYKIGKIEDAIFYCSKAIEINPENASAFLLRGNFYYHLNQGKDAILNYSKAIEINPNYSEAYFNRGNAYLKFEKNFEKAKDDWEVALMLAPSLKEDLEYKIELVFNHLESKSQNKKKTGEVNSDIIIPDFDFKNLFENENSKASSEEIKPEMGGELEEKFARGEKIIPAEAKQLHDEISTPFPKDKPNNSGTKPLKKSSSVGIWIVVLIVILIITIAGAVIYYIYFIQQSPYIADTLNTKTSFLVDTSTIKETAKSDTSNISNEQNESSSLDTLNKVPFVIKLENRSDIIIIGENKGIYLQFGSYTRKGAAEKKLEEYSSKGLNVFIEEKTDDNITIYKVRCGPYSSIDEAKAVVKNLQ